MARGACYVRVSTDNQLENYSIEEQTDRLKAYCTAKDIQIVKFYTDGGYSGGTINRPALRQMLADIERKAVDLVVVYKLDRLSRSQKDTLTLIEDKFLANHVDFVSVNENFDTTTPLGRAMIGILSVFAQLEKDQITERFTMGRIGRAKNGYFHGGGHVPTGYDYIDGLLVVNEYEALQVRELYRRFVRGHSIYDCWQYMKGNYSTKYGSWKSEALVRNVLKNQLYTGKVKFKGEVYQGNHQPIISESLFQQAQELLSRSKKGQASQAGRPFKASTLLSGMLYCGICGARYHGEHGKYSCYSRTKGDQKYVVDPNCKNKKWSIPELDNLVIDWVSRMQYEDLKRRSSSSADVREHSRRIKEIDAQISRLIALYQEGKFSMDPVSRRIDALSEEKAALENDSAMASLPPVKEQGASAQKVLLSLLKSGTLQEKRACLSHLIDKIIITGEDVTICLRPICQRQP